MDLSTGLRRIRNKIVGNFTNLYLGQPNPGGSTIGSKSRTGMHSGRRIQQHLDTNSGFQFDVIIGDNIEFAIPDRSSQDWIRQAEFSDGQISGFANLPLFGRRSTDRPNDLGSSAPEPPHGR
jgi:hypothetical protein